MSTKRQLRVGNLPRKASEDLLTNYFERPQQFEDVEVKDVDLAGNHAVVTFSSEADVACVLDTHRKRPCVVSGCTLDIDRVSEVKREPPARVDREPIYSDEYEGLADTIEVRGFSESVSDDLLQNYFENEFRSGGGRIAEFQRTEDCATIKYEDRRAVAGVLAKTHTVGGCHLSVKPLIMNKKSLLLTDLPDRLTEETIRNYLEAKLQTEVDAVTFSNDQTKVVVDFARDIDLEKARSVCRQFPLLQTYLTPRAVAVTTSMMVTGIRPVHTDESMLYYFENRNKSGGKDVDQVEMFSDQGYCLVHFKYPDDLKSVCRREHTLSGASLTVRPYHRCLGAGSGGGASAGKLVIPGPIILSNKDTQKLNMSARLSENRVTIRTKLSRVHADIEWNEDPVRITCMLTDSDDGCHSHAKTWEDTVRRTLAEYTVELDMRTCDVSSETWKEAKSKLVSHDVKTPDRTSLLHENGRLVLVAPREDVDGIWPRIQTAVDEAEVSLRRKSQVDTARVPLKAKWKIDYLKAADFATDVQDKSEGMTVTYDTDASEVIFTGQKEGLPAAKMAMYDLLQGTSNDTMDFTQGRIRLLRKPAVRDQLNEQLQGRRLVCALEITEDAVYIHGRTDGIRKVQQCVDNLLADFTIPLSPDVFNSVVKSSKWDTFENDLRRRNQGLVEIEISSQGRQMHVMHVTCLDERRDALREDIDEFLQTNALVTKREDFREGPIIEFIAKFYKQKVERELEKCRSRPKYKFEGATVVITGTEEDVQQMRRVFSELAGQVHSQQHRRRQVGIQKFLTCPAGRECLDKLAASCRCVIHVGGGDSRDGRRGQGGDGRDGRRGQDGDGRDGRRGQGGDSDRRQGGHGRERDREGGARSSPESRDHQRGAYGGGGGGGGEVTINGNVKLKVVQGDLTDQRQDVIVVTASRNLHFRGRLHDKIIHKGGKRIRSDCDSRIKRKGQLRDGEVFLGTGGDLPCKAIAHAVIAQWDSGSGGTETLKDVIENCLRKSEKRGFTSIVIPGLGMGQLHYPTHVACKTIVTTVKAYFEKTTSSMIRKVVLCDVNGEIVQTFEDCVEKKFGQFERREPREPREHHEERREREPSWRESRSRSPAPSGGVRIGPATITVVAGYLAKEKVDVIVDSAPADLHLKKGKCSKALLDAGGYRIQKECESSYSGGITPGTVAVTTGGKLGCEKIFHITLKQYSRESQEEAIDGFRASIEKCLEQADSSGFTSISIPSAGTGSMRYPSSTVAREMFSCLKHYFKSNPRSGVTTVRLVVFPGDGETIKAFQDEEKKFSRGEDQDDVEVVYRRGGDDDAITVTYQGAKIILVRAHLAKEKADVIVNSTSQELKLDRGRASKAILRAAGAPIQQELDQNFSGGVTAGQVAVTSPGNLACKKLFHVGVPPFDKDKGEECMKGLADTITACLTEATKAGLSSVSIPPVGAGALRYPKAWLAGKTYACLDKYFQDNANTTVKTVRIVVFPDDNDIFAAFKKEAMKHSPDMPDGAGTRQRTQESLGHFMSKEKNECVLRIYSDARQNINDAAQSFDATADREWCSRKFEDQEVIPTLNHNQVKAIKDDFKQHNVFAHINVDAGCIIAYGLARDLLQVSDKLDQIMRKQYKFLSMKKEARLTKNIVRWYFIVNQKEIPFGDIDNMNIEKAYQKKDAQSQVKNRAGKTFVVDFGKMHSYESSQPGQTSAVIRRDNVADATGTVPSHWTKSKASDTVTLVPLAQGSQEYTKVLNDFTKTLGRQPTIVKIERVQNKTLWIQYDAKLNSINLQNNSKKNVTMLWHGTSVDIVPSIYTHGFNRSYCGHCAIGNGVYFAVGAQYSDGGYSRPDAQGIKRMFRCLVITGQTTKGASGMRVPPTRTTIGGAPVTYDSVSDNPGGPSMYVIFHDCQAYPEHLITYK